MEVGASDDGRKMQWWFDSVSEKGKCRKKSDVDTHVTR